MTGTAKRRRAEERAEGRVERLVPHSHDRSRAREAGAGEAPRRYPAAAPETLHHPAAAADERRPIELGWLVVGRLDEVDLAAARRARERLLATLRALYPAFDWQMPWVEHAEVPLELYEEPVALLDHGMAEREARGWDFCFVVAASDLVGHEKPFSVGAMSRAVAVGVMSTARLDPRAAGEELAPADREEAIERRLHALALHLLGHLNGLGHRGGRGDAMRDVGEVSDLDAVEGYCAGDVHELGEELAEVAALRLEEERRPPRGRLAFYARSAWKGRDDIADAVLRAKPWQFPIRLSRLTAAAVSALVVLMTTAEAWDLGMQQRPVAVALLSLLTLAGTTWFLLERQRLLVRRRAARLSERAAVSNISATLIVLTGLLVTYVALFAAALAVSRLVFPPAVVEEWAASLAAAPEGWRFFALAGFVAALGILIGALGASFEQQHYFRHVALIDEET